MIEDSTPHTEDEAQKLFTIAREIRVWQEGHAPKLSDNALLVRFPALGSTKTFKKLREGDMDQLDLAEWLPRYEGVLNQIATEADTVQEVILPDLSFAREIYQTTLRLVQSRGLNRLLIIEGGSGYGKTESLRLIARQLPGSVIYTDADESWAKPNVAVGQLCLATGAVKRVEELPPTLAGRLAILVERLKTRRVVLIDEGHHLSGATLNVLKTLLNRTASSFVIAALDTLWRKLQANAWQEAKQLVFNRMFARIRLVGPTADDAKKFFASRLSADGDLGPAIKAIVPVAQEHGGMAFLRNAAERCRQLGAVEVDSATLLEAAAHVKRQVEGR